MIFSRKFGLLLLKIGVPLLIVTLPALIQLRLDVPEVLPLLTACIAFGALLTLVGMITVLRGRTSKAKGSFLTKDVSVPTAAILGFAIGTWAIVDPNAMSRWLPSESRNWIISFLRESWGPYLGAILILWGLANTWWLFRKRTKHNQSSEVTASSRTSS